ncbi:hypothetical protein [Streptomyces sp. NPDC004528]|uniref:hypothetical protein n=1 Tax=Streptomyces sp. NPDC004528 TaxID=3154550 RepID=UPI0033BA92DC
MSSDTLTKIAEAVPDGTASPRAVPRRRLGRWTAAAVVPAPVGPALGSVESHHARGAERTR